MHMCILKGAAKLLLFLMIKAIDHIFQALKAVLQAGCECRHLNFLWVQTSRDVAGLNHMAGMAVCFAGLSGSLGLQLWAAAEKYLQAVSFEHHRSCCVVPLHFPPHPAAQQITVQLLLTCGVIEQEKDCSVLRAFMRWWYHCRELWSPDVTGSFENPNLWDAAIQIIIYFSSHPLLLTRA